MYSPIEDDGSMMGIPSSGEIIPPDQTLKTSIHICFVCLFARTVPSVPRNLTVVASSSTSLQVTWEHPLCEYGVLVNYIMSKMT